MSAEVVDHDLGSMLGHQQRFFPKVAADQALLDGAYSEARAGVIGLPDTVATSYTLLAMLHPDTTTRKLP